MATQDYNLTGTIKRLYERCKDGEHGYRRAAEHAEQFSLKKLFGEYAEQRANFAAALQAELGRHGAHDAKEGTIGEAVLQGWEGIKSAMTNSKDENAIAACVRSEEAARQDYEAALKHDLPPDVRTLLESQCATLRESQERIQALDVLVR